MVEVCFAGPTAGKEAARGTQFVEAIGHAVSMTDQGRPLDAQQLVKRSRHKDTADADLPSAQSAPQSNSSPASSSQQVTSAAAAEQDLSSAVDIFSSGVNSLQSCLSTLLHAAEQEKERIQHAKQQLAEEKAAFECEKQRVEQIFADNDQVLLNVGGHRYTTTVSTLRGAPDPSLFAAMFSGRHKVVKSEDGSVFIDRDGRHFADILNYLRTNQLAYPPDGTHYKYLLELRAEAEYYGLTGLTKVIDRYPYGLVKVVRGLQHSTDDTWVYEDGADEVVLQVDSAVQLLGVGLCGSDSGYTAELEVMEVGADFSGEADSLASEAQTFTKGDGSIFQLFLSEPVTLLPDKYYMLSVLVKGSESFCCEDCMDVVVVGGVRITFQCWESPNGTNEQRGQFPELYIRPIR